MLLHHFLLKKRYQVFFGIILMAIITFKISDYSKIDVHQYYKNHKQVQEEDRSNIPAMLKVNTEVIDIMCSNEKKDAYILTLDISFIYDPKVILDKLCDAFIFEGATLLKREVVEERALDAHNKLYRVLYVIKCQTIKYVVDPIFNQFYISLMFVNDQLVHNITIMPKFIISDEIKVQMRGMCKIIDCQTLVEEARIPLDSTLPHITLERSTILLTIFFEKEHTRTYLAIILLFLLFFMSCFSLIIGQKNHNRIARTMANGALIALISYRYIIGSISKAFCISFFAQELYIFILCAAFINVMFTHIAKYQRGNNDLTYTIQCQWYYLSLILMMLLVYAI